MGQKYKEPDKTTTSGGVMTGSGTLDPKTQAAMGAWAASQGAGAGTTGKSNVITGVSLGVDPETGKQIYPTDAQGNVISLYPTGSEQNLIKKLPPEKRIQLQKQLLAIGAYPEGYRPSGDGLVTREDFDAISKLIAVGEQKGIGNIDAVIKLAKTDKAVSNYIRSGGYVKQGPVLTDTREAGATLTDTFLNLFNEKPTKEEVKAYQNLLNARERTAKGGMSAQERQDILYSVANKRLASLTSGALTGDAAANEALTEGQLGKRIRDIKAAYEENGMAVSDKRLFSLAGKSLRSAEAYDNILEDINQNVGLQWGQLGQNLKPGQTVRSRLQPYINIWSSLSGIPEDEIKTTDLQDVVKPDGTFLRPQEYKMVKYKSKEYLNSDTYKQTVLNDTEAVLRNFGIG